MRSKMTSRAAQSQEAYVWIWLPGSTQPVVAGLLARQRDGRLAFNYGQSYLKRGDAISIYDGELPLRKGDIPPQGLMQLPSSIRDGSPDAWGRRVIINRTTGLTGKDGAAVDLDELTYLLESGSDRIGMLDFQTSHIDYVARQYRNATLEELLRSAERVERGIPLTPELDQALQHGSSIGGARPKALIDSGARKYIAKFSATNDLYSVVKAEYVAMRLADRAGIHVAPVKLVKALGRDVLLVERFDRSPTEGGWVRHGVVSALTLLGLDETEARYASYEEFATLIRHRFANPNANLAELFSRLTFNILCGNTDDHARNHAALWDGKALSLTPAYDICPQGRAGGEASQAMLITGNKRLSQLAVCLEAAPQFLLTQRQAKEIIDRQISTINSEWTTICDEAKLGEADRTFFWHRQFLNPYAFEGLPTRTKF